MFARVWLLAAVAFVALVGVTDAGYHGWVVQNTFRTRRLYTICQTCRIFSCPSGYHWSHYSGCSFWSASCHYHCNRDECRPGYYGSTGGHLNLVCNQCGSGKYSGQGKSSCSTCAAGKYSNGARTGCSNCPGGKTSSAGSGSCTWNTKNPTKSPTKNPTKAPTKSPTTRAPTSGVTAPGCYWHAPTGCPGSPYNSGKASHGAVTDWVHDTYGEDRGALTSWNFCLTTRLGSLKSWCAKTDVMMKWIQPTKGPTKQPTKAPTPHVLQPARDEAALALAGAPVSVLQAYLDAECATDFYARVDVGMPHQATSEWRCYRVDELAWSQIGAGRCITDCGVSTSCVGIIPAGTFSSGMHNSKGSEWTNKWQAVVSAYCNSKAPTNAPTNAPTPNASNRLAELTGSQLSGLTDSGGPIAVDPEVQILVDKWTTSVRGELKSKGSSKAKKKKMFKKEKKFRNKKGKDTLKLDMKEYFTPGMTKRARNKLRKVMLSIARTEMRAQVPAEMGSDFEEPPMSFGLDEAGLGASFKARAEASGALEVLVTFAPAKTESQTAPGATQCEEADVDLVDVGAPVDVVCAAVGDVALVCHGALPVTRMTLTGEGNSQSGVDEYHVKCWSGAGWDAGSFVETEDTYTCGGRTFYVQSLGVAPDDGTEVTATADTTQVAVVGDSMYVCGSLFAGRCKVWNLSSPGSFAYTAQPAGATFGAVPTAALAMGAATITFSDSSIAVTTGAGADREDHEFPFACACA